jgi:hypothetical protein
LDIRGQSHVGLVVLLIVRTVILIEEPDRPDVAGADASLP